MPNIGFMELLLISIVALLVLGPEKLPQAARTAALWIGRARRGFNKVKADIEREINADDIRRQLHNESILADLDEAKEKANRLTRDTRESFSSLEDEVRSNLENRQTTRDRQSADSDTGDRAAPRPSDTPAPEADNHDAGPDETATRDGQNTADADPDRAGEPEKDEKPKPVTDFYNNPPDSVVTVQGRKFKAGKDDDDKA